MIGHCNSVRIGQQKFRLKRKKRWNPVEKAESFVWEAGSIVSHAIHKVHLKRLKSGTDTCDDALSSDVSSETNEQKNMHKNIQKNKRKNMQINIQKSRQKNMQINIQNEQSRKHFIQQSEQFTARNPAVVSNIFESNVPYPNESLSINCPESVGNNMPPTTFNWHERHGVKSRKKNSWRICDIRDGIAPIRSHKKRSNTPPRNSGECDVFYVTDDIVTPKTVWSKNGDESSNFRSQNYVNSDTSSYKPNDGNSDILHENRT